MLINSETPFPEAVWSESKTAGDHYILYNNFRVWPEEAEVHLEFPTPLDVRLIYLQTSHSMIPKLLDIFMIT
jgi:hypothetical protein